MVPGCLAAALLSGDPCTAATFDLRPGTDVVGEPEYVDAEHEDTLVDLGRLYNIGLNELKLANPGVNTWLPGENTTIVIPTRYVLPDAPRQDIVINVPELRLYHYPADRHRPVVVTYPISVGRQDWQTPKAITRIVSKVRDPAWYPPESIREEHAADGRPLPRVVPPGPDNPLGGYAMRLGLPGYLIHGTNKPNGVGLQVTHGCIRLYPEDIRALFGQVSTGSRVQIVNQPVKTGWRGTELFLEIHPEFEAGAPRPVDRTRVVEHIMSRIEKLQEGVAVDWPAVKRAMDAPDGLATAIAKRAPGKQPAPPIDSGNKDPVYEFY